MKAIISKIFSIGLIAVLFVLFTVNCSSAKDTSERRNFMIPKKSEMARNSRYKEVEKRKTNKISLNKSKRKSLF